MAGEVREPRKNAPVKYRVPLVLRVLLVLPSTVYRNLLCDSRHRLHVRNQQSCSRRAWSFDPDPTARARVCNSAHSPVTPGTRRRPPNMK